MMADTAQDCRRHQFNLAVCRWLVFLLCFRIFLFGQQVSISAKRKRLRRRRRCHVVSGADDGVGAERHAHRGP